MNYYLYLAIYFFVGIIQDFLLTLNWRFVAKEKNLPAAFSSFFTTVVSMLVLYNILTQIDSEKSIVAIIVYSLGIGVGTFLAMKLRIQKDKSK
jgi:uncharacterized protein YebE (UPF0316 family)